MSKRVGAWRTTVGTLKENANIFFEILNDNKMATVFLLLLAVINVFAFSYYDGRAYTAWTVEMWDAFFSGRSVQQVIAENMRASPAVDNSQNITGSALLTLLPWMVWNFPIWVTSSLCGGKDVLTTGYLFWSHLYLLFFGICTGLACYHIVYYFTGDHSVSKLGAIFFWGSGTLWICIGYSMQDEIVYLFTFLAALRCFCEKKEKRCLAWLVITVTQCPFMIMPALVLFLIERKNLFVIAGKAILCLTPYFVADCLLPANGWGFDLLGWFFMHNTLDTGLSGNRDLSKVSLFAVVLILSYVYSYFFVPTQVESRNQSAVIILTVLMTAMSNLAWLHFYRWVLCIPFLIISVLITSKDNDDRMLFGLLLIAAFETSRLIGLPIYDENCLAANYFTKPVKTILSGGANVNISNILRQFVPSLNLYVSLISSTVFALATFLLWSISLGKRVSIGTSSLSRKNVVLLHTWIPLLLLACLFCAHWYCCGGVFASIDGNGELATNFCNGGVAEEYYYSQVNCHVKKASFRFVTWNYSYPEDMMICYEIIDAQTGDTLWYDSIAANELIDNSIHTFESKNVQLQKKRWYIFRVYAAGTLQVEQQLCPIFSQEGSADLNEHYSAVSLDRYSQKEIKTRDITETILLTR